MTYIGLLICGALLTGLLVYPTRILASRLGAVAVPGGRSIHTKTTPLMGGLAIFGASILLSVGILIFLRNDLTASLRQNGLKLVGLLLGSVFIVGLGAWDDIYKVSARFKLLGQIVAAGVMLFFGYTIKAVYLPGVGVYQLGIAGYFVFILWVVAVTNAVNLIDGLDGLASIACLFTAFGSGLIALQTGNVFIGFFSFLLVGCLLGFLLHNFPPATIFLGDTGSLLIGFVLAVTVIEGSTQTQARTTALMIAGPLLLLGFSLMDVVISIIRRFLRGKPIFSADIGHIHHRLMFHFKNPRRVLIVVSAFCALTTIAAVGIQLAGSNNALFWSINALVIFIALLFIRLLGYFRVHELTDALSRREEVKFLFTALHYLRYRLRRTRSFDEMFRTLTLACEDFAIARMEIRDEHAGVLFSHTTNWRASLEMHRVEEEEIIGAQTLHIRFSFIDEGDAAFCTDLKLARREFFQSFWIHWNRLQNPASDDALHAARSTHCADPAQPNRACENEPPLHDGKLLH